MGHVVEAFRFLSARVATLEARLAAQDRPVEGAAWLAPARELGDWVGPVTAHMMAARPVARWCTPTAERVGLLADLAGAGVPVHRRRTPGCGRSRRH